MKLTKSTVEKLFGNLCEEIKSWVNRKIRNCRYCHFSSILKRKILIPIGSQNSGFRTKLKQKPNPAKEL